MRMVFVDRRDIEMPFCRVIPSLVSFEFRGIDGTAVEHFDNAVFEVGDRVANDLVDQIHVIGLRCL